jgi:ketosteroid isomerase-like protein
LRGPKSAGSLFVAAFLLHPYEQNSSLEEALFADPLARPPHASSDPRSAASRPISAMRKLPLHCPLQPRNNMNTPAMSRLLKPAIVLAFSAIVSISLRAADELSPQQQEVWKTVETYWALDAAGNTQEFLSYFHADYKGWSYGNVLPGSKQRAAKFIAHGHKTTKTLVTDLQPVTVRVHGNMAYVHYLFVRIVKDAEDKEKRETGRWTDILLKDGAKWVMIADHGGEFPPKP